MKIKLLPFALLVAFGLAGCANNNSLPDTPVPVSGTFTGQFKLYHVNSAKGTSRVDSAYLNLVMEAATGYKITGDTTTVHAGSYGNYAVNSSAFQILFNDVTFSASAPPTKVHLAGIYNYHFDGVNLQLSTYGPADTLQYFYTFKKTGN